jgi:hypothetical protein
MKTYREEDITPKVLAAARKLIATPLPGKLTPAKAEKVREAKLLVSVYANDVDAFLSACALRGVPLTFAEHEQNMRNSAYRNQTRHGAM